MRRLHGRDDAERREPREVEGMEPIEAKAGDFVHVPAGKAHRIRTVGVEPSLRLAVVITDVQSLDPETGKPQ